MITNATPVPEDEGGRGGLVPYPDDLACRSKLRFLEHILAFPRPNGEYLIPPDQAANIIKGLVPALAIATKNAQDKDAGDQEARVLRRYYGIWTSLARLEQSDKPREHEHRHLHAHGNIDEVIELLEAEVRRRGIDEEPQNGAGNGSA